MLPYKRGQRDPQEEEIFFWGEQRDPHGEGSHLNASKADSFFDNTGEFLEIVLIIFVRNS